MENPKMFCVQHIYNRPSPSGAVGSVLDEYLRIKLANGLTPEVAVAEVLGEAQLATKDFLKRRKEELAEKS